jgi:chromosomal replication initiation ATPase DnaA
MNKTAGFYSMSHIDDLIAGNKVRRTSRWRQALAWVARRLYRVPLVDIARGLHRSESTVSMMITRHQDIATKSSETLELMRVLRRQDTPVPLQM